MGVFSTLENMKLTTQIKNLLIDCPSEKIHFDDKFSFFLPTEVEDEYEKFDILFIEKRYDGFSVRINDELFDERSLDYLPANMIYLKLQTLLNEWK